MTESWKSFNSCKRSCSIFKMSRELECNLALTRKAVEYAVDDSWDTSGCFQLIRISHCRSLLRHIDSCTLCFFLAGLEFESG
jgi:hypothetical protein